MSSYVAGLLVLLLLSTGVSTAQPAGDPELEAAKALYHDGRFTEAAARLEAVCQKLGRTGPRRHELSDAYLYLGLAYVAVNDRTQAKASFRELARLDHARRLDPEVYAPKVVELFEEARGEVSAEALTLPPPRAAGTAAKKRGSKLPYVILGTVAGVGGGAALALGGRKPSPPTQARLTIAPEGQAITGITVMTFQATATDPSGLATYSWNFGDGATASGTTATHVYDREGAFGVVLTVANKGGSATASGSVTARSLTGTWRPDFFFAGCFSLRMTHGGSRVDAVAVNGSSAAVTVTNPRQILMSIAGAPAQNCGAMQNFNGTFDPALDSFTMLVPGTAGQRDTWRRQ